MTNLRLWDLEYAECEVCREVICRAPAGPWEHYDTRDDWDHLPEPILEPHTEHEAEVELANAVDPRTLWTAWFPNATTIETFGEML